jgi:hypothetical protein
VRHFFSIHLVEVIPVLFVFLLFGSVENIHISIRLFFYVGSAATKHVAQDKGIS